jgi:hypothetical protein
LENVIREQALEVAFDGFPEAGLERVLGHGLERIGDDDYSHLKTAFATTSASTACTGIEREKGFRPAPGPRRGERGGKAEGQRLVRTQIESVQKMRGGVGKEQSRE